LRSKLTERALENQALKSDILVPYSRSKKRMGAYKIRQHVAARWPPPAGRICVANVLRLMVEYNKRVSVGKVYRLMKSMALPKMSTVKPKTHHQKGGEENLKNLLNKEFNPKAPNQVWVSDPARAKALARARNLHYVC